MHTEWEREIAIQQSIPYSQNDSLPKTNAAEGSKSSTAFVFYIRNHSISRR